MKTGIFYGSSTGTTAEAAHKIAKAMRVADEDVFDVDAIEPTKVTDYDLLVLGTSTWGDGELQDDWEDFIAALEVMDLEGKEIALFGTGDEKMADTFCNGVGVLYNRLKGTGARFIGSFNTDGYTFDHSDAVGDDGIAVGLLLDEVNHADTSDQRIQSWTQMVETEM